MSKVSGKQIRAALMPVATLAEYNIIAFVDRNYEQISELVSKAVTRAFADLLTNRHLYQSVEISLTEVDHHIAAKADAASKATHEWMAEDARQERLTLGDLHKRKAVEAAAWDVTPASRPIAGWGASIPTTTIEGVVYFELPTIHSVCPVCEERWPFNPIPLVHASGTVDSGSVISHSSGDEFAQVFVCAYQCQSCKTEPLVFLVRRRGKKLKLSGRSKIETVAAPTMLPKHLHNFYSDAVIAYNAGKILPGLFLLRVVIEQFWRELKQRGVLVVDDTNPRIPAEQLAASYNSILPNDFKDRFPSLGKLYDDISDCLHSATADDKLFERAKADIEEHFDARRLWKLDAEDQKRVTGNSAKSKQRTSHLQKKRS
jgi:hypothetical protein